jgi:ferredoxin
MNLSTQVRRFAKNLGVDLIGFAPIERFSNASVKGGIDPGVYLKGASGVLVMACRIQSGIRKSTGPYTVDGKTYGPYLWYGYGYLNWFLSECAYRVASYLESRGYLALPFPPTGPTSMYRRYEGFIDLPIDKPFSADISHRHAAVAAGLGEIGFSGLFLTPEFGSRQRLVTIVTNAPIEASNFYSGQRLCDAKRCGICINSCPTLALSKQSTHKVTIGRRVYEYARVNYTRCIMGVAGFTRRGGARTDLEMPPQEVDLKREFFKMNREKRNVIDFSMTSEPVHMNLCGLCLLSCPAPLKPSSRTRK